MQLSTSRGDCLLFYRNRPLCAIVARNRLVELLPSLQSLAWARAVGLGVAHRRAARSEPDQQLRIPLLAPDVAEMVNEQLKIVQAAAALLLACLPWEAATAGWAEIDLLESSYEQDDRVRPSATWSLLGLPQSLFDREPDDLALRACCRLLDSSAACTLWSSSRSNYKTKPEDDSSGLKDPERTRCEHATLMHAFNAVQQRASLQMSDIEPYRISPHGASEMYDNPVKNNLCRQEAEHLFNRGQDRIIALRDISMRIESTLRSIRADYNFMSPRYAHQCVASIDGGCWRVPLIGWGNALHKMVHDATNAWSATQQRNRRREQERKAIAQAKLAMWKLKHEYWIHLDEHTKRELAACIAELMHGEGTDDERLSAEVMPPDATSTTSNRVAIAAPSCVNREAQSQRKPEPEPQREIVERPDSDPKLMQQLAHTVEPIPDSALERLNAQLKEQAVAQAERTKRIAELEASSIRGL